MARGANFQGFRQSSSVEATHHQLAANSTLGKKRVASDLRFSRSDADRHRFLVGTMDPEMAMDASKKKTGNILHPTQPKGRFVGERDPSLSFL